MNDGAALAGSLARLQFVVRTGSRLATGRSSTGEDRGVSRSGAAAQPDDLD